MVSLTFGVQIVAHSVGTWCAFEFLQLARTYGLSMPQKVFFSAMASPNIAPSVRPWKPQKELSDDQFQVATLSGAKIKNRGQNLASPFCSRQILQVNLLCLTRKLHCKLSQTCILFRSLFGYMHSCIIAMLKVFWLWQSVYVYSVLFIMSQISVSNLISDIMREVFYDNLNAPTRTKPVTTSKPCWNSKQYLHRQNAETGMWMRSYSRLQCGLHTSRWWEQTFPYLINMNSIMKVRSRHSLVGYCIIQKITMNIYFQCTYQ